MAKKRDHITIVHLSDLHIHRSNRKAENRNAACLVKHLLQRFGDRAKERTVIALTGDLVDDGGEKQYTRLKDLVLAPLEEAFTVIPVPGNHDYAGRGWRFRKEAPELFKQYVSHHDFPHVYNVDQVTVISLDTGDRENNVFFANGSLYGEQLDKLGTLLRQYRERFIVVCMHHHPIHYRNWFTGFIHSEEFMRAVYKRVNLVLFGHKHHSQPFFNNNGVPLMLASGRVTKPDRGVLMYRTIELDPNEEGFGSSSKGMAFHITELPAAAAD